MALRMESAGSVVDGIIRMRDWDPEQFTLSGCVRKTLEQGVNDALARVYAAQKWPALMRTEMRRYRPAWAADVAYAAGNEVWHAGTGAYWRALAGNTGEEPAEGGEYWEKPETFIPFIQFEQPWEEWGFDVCGVDLEAFAWPADPRLHPGMRAIGGCELWMDSVVLPQGVPDAVWVRFVPQAPVISFTEWGAGTAYGVGDRCYRTATGRSYVATQAGTGKNPDSETEYWTEVGVPAFVCPYVRMAALSQWLTVAEGRYEMEGRAAKELEDLAGRMFDRMNVAQGMRARCGFRV